MFTNIYTCFWRSFWQYSSLLFQTSLPDPARPAQSTLQEKRMKAVIYTQYGSPDVLQLKEIERPEPKENELLVRVYAASVNYGDLAARNFKGITPQKFNMLLLFWFMAKLSFGLEKPKINVLGSEFSGVVETVGKNVTRYKKGDAVFGYLGQNMGAYAEYLCIPENGVLAAKPENITFEEAAAASYGAIMALNLLKRAGLKAGEKILINGASGGIGSAAVQIARSFGAEVTGVCSTPRLEFVRSLGAERVIDYTREDFTQNGETYDLIFDILGRSSFSRCQNSLKKNGRYLLASFKMKQLLQMFQTSLRGGKKVICALAPGSVEDLNRVKSLLETGKLKTVVDRCYPSEQAAEAHRRVEEGRSRGKVIITFKEPEK